MRRWISRPAAVLLLAPWIFAACGQDGGGDPAGPGADVSAPTSDTSAPIPPDPDVSNPLPPDPDTSAPLPPDPLPPPERYEEFGAALASVREEAEALSVEDFLARYDDGGETISELSYAPSAAAFMAEIDTALALTGEEQAHLEREGFVVLDRTAHPTYLTAYDAVYADDLPVLVTTDSILHAVHRSYDELLKSLELTVLIPALERMLATGQAHLSGIDTTGDPLLADAVADAELDLTAARSLLADGRVAAALGAAQDEAIDALLAHIAREEGLADVMLFGSARRLDTSQFKPRGHYEDDPALQRYFRSMMWLGRTDLRLRRPDPYNPTEWKFDHRAMTVAYVLYRALEDTGAMADWLIVDRIIEMMVGERDSMDMAAMTTFLGDAGITDYAGVSLADPAVLEEKLVAGGYGTQRIASHWLETDPFSSEVTPLPLSFTFMGQRYVVDSHVFSSVVYDRLVVDGVKVLRMLPDPRDVLFALGHDRVAPRLVDELEQAQHQGNLHMLRYLVDSYPEDFWAANLYNGWLQAIRSLNVPTTDATYPEPMRTEAWLDKTMNTQLASWAELRHDTLLYAKQSYTGGIACTYPDGYVEPYPDFFAALADYAARARENLATVTFADSWQQDYARTYFEDFEETMTRLEGLARKELADEPFGVDELAFLDDLIRMDPGCGDPVYSGWYPKLFWGGVDLYKEWKPTIADVHTDANDTLACGQPCANSPQVLHVGTGHINLMVFTTDSCEGPRAYVGPVTSYYEHRTVRELVRLTDSEWQERLTGTEPPLRPTWTGSFVR